MGKGYLVPKLRLQTWNLLYRCITNRIALRARHLVEQLADALSRGKIIPKEWTLHPLVVQAIFQWFDCPHIDLFPSAFNNHLSILHT